MFAPVRSRMCYIDPKVLTRSVPPCLTTTQEPCFALHNFSLRNSRSDSPTEYRN